MARTLASAGEDALVDYVTLLEMIILKVDHRNIDTSEIAKACIGKKENIAKTIQRIIKEYQSEPAITSAVANLMNSPLFASYRRVLGSGD